MNRTCLFLLLEFLVLSPFVSAASASDNVQHSPVRTHPALEERKAFIKTIVMFPPRVALYQITAGGVTEKMDDWTASARKNLQAAVQKELAGKGGLVVKAISEKSLPPALETILAETDALFDVVSYSILVHTYGRSDHLFEEKLKHFDYSLGPEIHELDEQADAFLLIQGFDRRSTGGRKAMQAGAMLLGALVGVIPIPSPGGSDFTVALVEARSGTLLWYYRMGSGSDPFLGHDLRDYQGAVSFVQQFLGYFPIQ